MLTSKLPRSVAGSVLLAFALGAPPAAVAQLKIGVVNLAALAESSPQVKVMRESIEAEFKPRERAIASERKELEARSEKLKKEMAVMSEADRVKAERDLREAAAAHSRKRSDYEQDLSRRYQEETQKMNKFLADEVSAYARAQDLDLVIGDGVGVLYAKDSINITRALADALKAKPANLPPVPRPADKKP